VAKQCARCQRAFCRECVAPTDAGPFCADCRAGKPFRIVETTKSSVGLVVAFVVLGGLFVVCIITIIAAIAIPNLLMARKRANETAARGALWTIGTSESLFHANDQDKTKKLAFASLKQLGDAQLVDRVLASGTKQGYLFEARPSTTSPDTLWWAVARPEIPGTSGDRVFYMNQSSSVVYYCKFAGGDHDPGKPDPSTCELPAGLIPYGR
jgi:hypothetical protein